MGSIDAACISGFLCRLCSEMHRTVIHIYGDQGTKLKLAQKINDYLPVTITPSDPLPKTICETCMRRVEQHHTLMVTMAKNSAKFALRRQQALQQRNSTTTPPIVPTTPANTNRNTSESLTPSTPRLIELSRQLSSSPIEILTFGGGTTVHSNLIENRDDTATVEGTTTNTTIVINNNNSDNNNHHQNTNDIFEQSENETIFDMIDSAISNQISTTEQTENATTI